MTSFFMHIATKVRARASVVVRTQGLLRQITPTSLRLRNLSPAFAIAKIAITGTNSIALYSNSS